MAQGAVGRRWTVLSVWALALGQAAAFAWALRRYLVGIDGPLLPTAVVKGTWHPPAPAWALDVAFFVLAALWATCLCALERKAARGLIRQRVGTSAGAPSVRPFAESSSG